MKGALNSKRTTFKIAGFLHSEEDKNATEGEHTSFLKSLDPINCG